MYESQSNLIIGFHGTDNASAKALVDSPNLIRLSEEPWDWLGHGFYFWENNESRALLWAKERQKRKGLPEEDAAVVGAVLQLGYCSDLTDSRFTTMLQSYHQLMEQTYIKAGLSMPENKDAHGDEYKDRLIRVLDCAVIQFMHSSIEQHYIKELIKNGYSTIKIFDSVRGVFTEGGLIYAGAGIYAKSHIQLCIRNRNCIKGFFWPREETMFLPEVPSLK
jgi:hypothetical protein